MDEVWGFERLSELRNRLIALRRSHVPTLACYLSKDGMGFCHQMASPEEASLASTATCVTSLVRAGVWNDFSLSTNTQAVAQTMLDKKNSAQLDDYNPFSISFIAEAVLDLLEAQRIDKAESAQVGTAKAQMKKVKKTLAPMLAGYLRDGYGSEKSKRPGSIGISPYPPSAYLTQLTFRVVQRCGLVTPEIAAAVRTWAREEINRQIALITARSRNADPLQLAYSIILAVTTVKEALNSPEDKEILSHALALFFDQQRDNGTWPPSRPMFHYKSVGSAYCFDYEVLAQLLLCVPLRDELLRYIPKLNRSVANLTNTFFDLEPTDPEKKIAWASGHHPQIEGPESWSTASVYDFAHALDRLVAEAIRRTIFSELKVIYPGPPASAKIPPKTGFEGFAEKFLDADLRLSSGKPLGLRGALAQRFVFPIAREAERVGKGGQLSDTTPMSAIFYGPPGTSKTQLAKIIAGYLNWPLLSVDPSYVVQEGLDKVQAMANRLFEMLIASEQVVVLLDEFDEMGRDRSGNDNLLSRFITTAMLPKLAAINKERKIVFLLATNYLRNFDAAFRRGGRFDMQLQIMPPNLSAKLNADQKAFPKWSSVLKNALVVAGESPPYAKRGFVPEEDALTLAEKIEELTFLETQKLVSELEHLTIKADIIAAIERAWDVSTLKKNNDGGRNKHEAVTEGEHPSDASPGQSQIEPAHPKRWRDTSNEESKEITLPP